MKKKTSLKLGGIMMIFIVGCFYFYFNHISNTAILKNAINRKGYTLNIDKESIEIDLFIKPEWIPFESDQPKNYNLKLCTKYGTDIILTQIWNRGNDIYFSFNTSYQLNYKKGEFLYNGIFYEDGTFTYNSKIDNLVVYHTENESISLGQKGVGPNSSFSFGIQPEEYDKIQNGFYIKYSGMTLYTYSLN